jgi:glycosyltransferase involved in cell wall biosynthesis/predicted O-methyltransferase YrrM
METARPNVTPLELLAEVRRIAGMIPADAGGGCPVPKAFLMASIALQYRLGNYLEIGVYRGRSFLPMAVAVQRLGGRAYGVDAYDREVAREHDLPEKLREPLNAFIDTLDFARIHADVTRLREALGVAATSEIIRAPSAAAVTGFRQRGTPIDMLHIDGNHDTRHVLQDVDSWVPLVRDGGVVVLDDIDWDPVRPASNRLKRDLALLFSDGRFAVFLKGGSGRRPSEVETLRLRLVHSLAENLERSAVPRGTATSLARRPVVSVVVLAYNQERYVGECLQGILAQQGDFRLELVIGDDASDDGTMDVIESWVNAIPPGAVDVRLLSAEENLGISRNLERCLRACTGDYVAICEGDDYWIDPHKLQAQVDFLRTHPGCALCFNDVYIYVEDSGEFLPFEPQQQLPAEVLTTRDLIEEYLVGNISCCMYDARHLEPLPASLFDLFIGDWMWNIYYSRFGDIGHLSRKMSVYRRHRGGAWSGKPELEKARLLHGYIDGYNRFLGYEYDELFSARQRKLAAPYPGEFDREPCELAILDDVFPHPLSAFRLQEFSVYLREFPRARVYSSGESLRVLGSTPLHRLVSDFKRRHPDHAGQLEPLQEDMPLRARLVYLVFLGNAYVNLGRIEAARTPFVFCLYPGGMFGLDNPRSDSMLRRVTSSPCFRKVLVTQRVTYDYLVAKGFCAPEQIEFVFGVVTPPAGDGADYLDKRRFGIDKDTLDICFVAHKYTARGVDKGYDVFVAVAERLHRRHGDIRFHVVGGFDEHDIDVTGLGDRITFHGPRPTEWFDEFYRDKDIILSPNRPSTIFSGAFDGFPTGTCIDAGLRRAAVFCTDPLRLNTHFADGEEIVVVPHDAETVTAIVERYHREPRRLAELADRGYRKIRQLYSLEAQMGPRLALLRRELELADSSRTAIRAALDRRRSSGRLRGTLVRLAVALVRHSPPWLRGRARRALGAMRASERCVRILWRFCPEPVWRFYRRVRDAS